MLPPPSWLVWGWFGIGLELVWGWVGSGQRSEPTQRHTSFLSHELCQVDGKTERVIEEKCLLA